MARADLIPREGKGSYPNYICNILFACLYYKHDLHYSTTLKISLRFLQADRQTDKRNHKIWTHGLTHGWMDIELRFRQFTFNVELSFTYNVQLSIYVQCRNGHFKRFVGRPIMRNMVLLVSCCLPLETMHLAWVRCAFRKKRKLWRCTTVHLRTLCVNSTAVIGPRLYASMQYLLIRLTHL